MLVLSGGCSFLPTTPLASVASLQVMACDVGAINLHDEVSVFTSNYPLRDTAVNQNISGWLPIWQDWVAPSTPAPPELSLVRPTWIPSTPSLTKGPCSANQISDFGMLSPASHTVQHFQFSDTGAAGNNTLSILEE